MAGHGKRCWTSSSERRSGDERSAESSGVLAIPRRRVFQIHGIGAQLAAPTPKNACSFLLGECLLNSLQARIGEYYESLPDSAIYDSIHHFFGSVLKLIGSRMGNPQANPAEGSGDTWGRRTHG